MANTTKMRLLKLTALSVMLVSFGFASCHKNQIAKDNHYVGAALPMNGAQETPSVSTSASGTIDADYSSLTKTLTYKITWTGLSGPAAAAHIHGTGEAGIAAAVMQTFSSFPAKTGGTYSNSIIMDGVKFTEEDLLAGRYYANIHTAAKPNGEIRGQIILTREQ